MDLYGHQKASSEIGLKTCMEMVEHAMLYQRAHSYTLIPDISSTVADVSRHCAQLISLSCFYAMHAASSVICRPIKSIYPVVNGPTDQYIHTNTEHSIQTSRI